MLELNTGYSFSQIPYLTYEELDDYGEQLVRDFAPELLSKPAALDVDSFVEFYLSLNVDYRRICYDRKILGMTAFNDGMIQVVSEDTGYPEPMAVTAGTLIIDTSLTDKRSLPRLRFTLMHEAAHWLLHRKAFAADNPWGSVGEFENRYLAAKEGRIDYSRCQKERSDNERMERQADFLASAILMPRFTLRQAFRQYFTYYDERPHVLIRGANPMDDAHAKQLPEYIAGQFGVSKRAALIRLEKLGAITGKQSTRRS